MTARRAAESRARARPRRPLARPRGRRPRGPAARRRSRRLSVGRPLQVHDLRRVVGRRANREQRPHREHGGDRAHAHALSPPPHGTWNVPGFTLAGGALAGATPPAVGPSRATERRAPGPVRPRRNRRPGRESDALGNGPGGSRRGGGVHEAHTVVVRVLELSARQVAGSRREEHRGGHAEAQGQACDRYHDRLSQGLLLTGLDTAGHESGVGRPVHETATARMGEKS